MWLRDAMRRVAAGCQGVVAALVAVNAVGDVIDPAANAIIAGARRPLVGGFVDSMAFAESNLGQTIADMANRNTSLAVVATNVALTSADFAFAGSKAPKSLADRELMLGLDQSAVQILSRGWQGVSVRLL